jgi:hypothetical protein
MDDLTAGYKLAGPRKSSYRGVLRLGRKQVWACRHDDHLAPRSAKACGEAELEKRTQGQGQVFTLLHCRPCAEAGGSCWWDDVPDVEELACPRCGVPLRRLKLVVVRSGPAVDEGNGKH